MPLPYELSNTAGTLESGGLSLRVTGRLRTNRPVAGHE
jgi:hypothetical protein